MKHATCLLFGGCSLCRLRHCGSSSDHFQSRIDDVDALRGNAGIHSVITGGTISLLRADGGLSCCGGRASSDLLCDTSSGTFDGPLPSASDHDILCAGHDDLLRSDDFIPFAANDGLPNQRRPDDNSDNIGLSCGGTQHIVLRANEVDDAGLFCAGSHRRLCMPRRLSDRRPSEQTAVSCMG
jgi:hypothetical protein